MGGKLAMVVTATNMINVMDRILRTRPFFKTNKHTGGMILLDWEMRQNMKAPAIIIEFHNKQTTFPTQGPLKYPLCAHDGQMYILVTDAA